MGFDVNNQMSLQDGLNAYRIQEGVLKAFQDRGFKLPDPPQYMTEQGPAPYQGTIPNDLTDLTDEQLGRYMSLLSGWIEYVSTEVSLADLSMISAKEQLEFTSAKIRLTYRLDEEGKKRTVQDIADLMRNDPRFVEANRAFLHLEGYHTLAKNKLKAAEQNYKAISRRISQTIADSERDTRNHGVSNRRVPTPGRPLVPGRGGL
jgi:hypothetical protein